MNKEDIELAKKARLNACSPYSNYQVGAAPTEECMPCGYCRQFMNEYVDEGFKVCTVDKEGNANELTINELLPHSFKF